MKVKAKIGQIIKWEDKEKYFFNYNFGNDPVDLIHLFYPIKPKTKFYQRGVMAMFLNQNLFGITIQFYLVRRWFSMIQIVKRILREKLQEI